MVRSSLLISTALCKYCVPSANRESSSSNQSLILFGDRANREINFLSFFLFFFFFWIPLSAVKYSKYTVSKSPHATQENVFI